MSVISLSPTPGREDAAEDLIAHVSERLSVEPRRGSDGTWEFTSPATYTVAHEAVVEALNDCDPRWPLRVTVEYALTA